MYITDLSLIKFLNTLTAPPQIVLFFEEYCSLNAPQCGLLEWSCNAVKVHFSSGQSLLVPLMCQIGPGWVGGDAVSDPSSLMD